MEKSGLAKLANGLLKMWRIPIFFAVPQNTQAYEHEFDTDPRGIHSIRTYKWDFNLSCWFWQIQIGFILYETYFTMLKVCVTLKGWMGKTLFPQWFARPHSCKGDPQGRQKFVWVDHCSSHVESLELTRILATTNTTLYNTILSTSKCICDIKD